MVPQRREETVDRRTSTERADVVADVLGVELAHGVVDRGEVSIVTSGNDEVDRLTVNQITHRCFGRSPGAVVADGSKPNTGRRRAVRHGDRHLITGSQI